MVRVGCVSIFERSLLNGRLLQLFDGTRPSKQGSQVGPLVKSVYATHTTYTATVPMDAVAPSLTAVEEVLGTLYGHGQGFVHLSTAKAFKFTATCADVGTLASRYLNQNRDLYLSGAVMATEAGNGAYGRSENADASQLTHLWVDLDGPDHTNDESRKGEYWTLRDIDSLVADLPVKPTVVTTSGAGFWLFFVLAEPVPLNADGSGEQLLSRWREYWIAIGERLGKQIDAGTFNAGRIVRAPGSKNLKYGEPRQGDILLLEPDRQYAVEDLNRILPTVEPREPKTLDHYSNQDRPGDSYNARATVEAVVALLVEEGFHSPQNLRDRVDLVRPGKDARAGRSVSVYREQPPSVTFWSSSPEGLPGAVELRDDSGASGSYDPFGLFAALKHNGDLQAAAQALTPLPAIRKKREAGVGRLLQADNLNTVKTEDVDWLVRPYIARRQLTLAAGWSAIGKSWFSLELALLLSRMGLNSLFISSENDPTTVFGPRWQEHYPGKGSGVLFNVRSGESDFATLTEEGISNLRTTVEHYDASLLVIDPVVRYFAGELNQANQVRRALAPLSEMAQELKIAVMGVHHLRKDSIGAKKDFASAVMGSTDFTGAIDLGVGLGRYKGQRGVGVYKSRIHDHESEPVLEYEVGGVLGFEFGPPMGIHVNQLLDSEPDDINEASENYLALISDGKDHPVLDIDKGMERMGHTNRVLRAVKKHLKDETGEIMMSREGRSGPWQVRLSSYAWANTPEPEEECEACGMVGRHSAVCEVAS